MDNKVPFKYFMLAHQYKQEAEAQKTYNDSLQRSLDRIAKSKRKTMSGQYLLMNFKDGKFCDPKIVEADGCEEAISPEDEIGTHSFVMPIPASDEFPDL